MFKIDLNSILILWIWYLDKVIPGKHDSKFTRPWPSIRLFGSHWFSLVVIHGPSGHQTQWDPLTSFPKSMKRVSMEVRHDSLSWIWLHGNGVVFWTQNSAKIV